MYAGQDVIVRQLIDAGFRATYHSTAVTLLGHPELPGLEVRVGTVYVVAERDGELVFGSQRAVFDIGEMLERIGLR